ncbi:serine/threonine protein kinase [Escherichia coli]|nr:serine/threonine protein kinase [Escherichia coli]
METGNVTGSVLVRIHVAHLPLSSLFLCILRSHSSWHYPKNGKTALNPRHYWLHEGSEQKKDPLPIWFYPR